MSKSEMNTVSLNEDPLSMYSKLEKVKDEIIPSYIELLTSFDLSILESKSPRELQRFMALEVTANFHGKKNALEAQSNCEKIYLGDNETVGKIPVIDLDSINFPIKFFYLLSYLKFFNSSSESKRAIKGGGVRIDNIKITNPDLIFNSIEELKGKIIQIGKKVTKRFND